MYGAGRVNLEKLLVTHNGPSFCKYFAVIRIAFRPILRQVKLNQFERKGNM